MLGHQILTQNRENQADVFIPELIFIYTAQNRRKSQDILILIVKASLIGGARCYRGNVYHTLKYHASYVLVI